MKLLQDLDEVTDEVHGCVLTIGNFDGVHRGHQQIMAQAGMFAEQTHRKVVVMTFDPHPLTIVAPARAPERLMTSSEKARCLFAAGAHRVVVARSDPELLNMTAEEFVERIIVQRFRPTQIVEGWSFGFGRGRRGDTKLLERLGPRYAYELFVVEPVNLQVAPGDTVLVSSSLIRELLSKGQVHRAQLCLGRPYALFGTVEHGHGRGRGLGFPTANLGGVEQLIPGEGVYAGWGTIDGEPYQAAISIGTTPTFAGNGLQVEAFLLDCGRELYGETMRLEFLELLRRQKKFDSPQSLGAQIREDVQRVRDLASDFKEH